MKLVLNEVSRFVLSARKVLMNNQKLSIIYLMGTLSFSMIWGWWYLFGAFAVLLVLFVLYSIVMYLTDLRSRAVSDNSAYWDVEINQVKVGTISDKDYAAIKLSVFKDTFIYINQAFNVCTTVARVIAQLLVFVPRFTFWYFAIIAIVSPESIIDQAKAIQGISADDVTKAIDMLVMSVFLPFAVIVGTLVVSGVWRPGFKNCFDAAIATELRQHCKTPTEGSMVLSR